MTRVLVVWEDAHCEALGALIKRAVHIRSPPDENAAPTVVRHTSRGHGAFARYVHDTWPLARARGVPLDPHPIDHVICVVDADRLHELKVIAAPPSQVSEPEAWHAKAELAWREWLHSQCNPDGPPLTTVHGCVLRWAKESVLLAGFDQPAWAQHIEVDVSAPAVQAELRRQCKPHPDEVPDASFTNTFRRPLPCLQLVRQACKLSRLAKNDVAIDDALYTLARESLPTILLRMPDLARLTSLIWSLHSSGPKPEAAPEPEAEPTTRPPRAPKTPRSSASAPLTTQSPRTPPKPSTKPLRAKSPKPGKPKRSR